MKVFDGTDTLTFEREKDTLTVFLESTQVKKESLEVIADNVSLDMEVPDGFYACVRYELSHLSTSLANRIAKTKNRLDKLRLAQKYETLFATIEDFRVPFVHPENIMVLEGKLSFVHFGVANLVSPMLESKENLLLQYKALVLNTFSPNTSYEKLVSGEMALNDKFSQKVLAFEDISSLSEFLTQELVQENQKVAASRTLVAKGRYRLLKVVAVLALILALVSGWFTYSYYTNSKKQEAIISSQNYFLTDNYSSTLEALKNYQPNQLPKTARYVLAVSSVNLSDLTMSQKQTILNTLSPKSDNNTLNYWLYIGRGKFNEALNLAQNLGDDQLTLLAYTDLYQSTKLNTTMNGAQKQKLLDDYTKKIQELSKNLGK